MEAGLEATLDIQYTVGIASGVPISFVSVDANFTAPDEIQEDFPISLQNEANYLLSLSPPPTVLTSSYGLDESAFSSRLAK